MPKKRKHFAVETVVTESPVDYDTYIVNGVRMVALITPDGAVVLPYAVVEGIMNELELTFR